MKNFILNLLFALICFTPEMQAQLVDSTFGVNGYVPSGAGPISNSANNRGTGNCMVMQPDGKLVVAIDRSDPNQFDLNFYTYRYNPDGSADATFGNNGVSAIFAGTMSKNYDLKLQSDGKIVVVGETEYCVNGVCGAPQFIMMRLLPDGGIDSTFGNDGKIITTDLFGISGTFAYPLKVHILNNGKFIICGRGMGGKPFIARLNTNGFPDNTYANNGVFTDTVTYYSFRDLAVNDQGEAFGLAEVYNYVNGTCDTSNNSDNYLIKLSATGTPDMTFGNGGRLQFSVSNADHPASIAIKQDQSLVVAGEYQPHNIVGSSLPFSGYGQTNSGYLAFVLPDGTMSNTVPNGFVNVDVPNDSSTFIHKVIVLDNDRLMISGRSISLVAGNFREKAFLGQVDGTGIPKTDFNTTGFMSFNYGQLATSGWNGTLACFNDIDVSGNGEAHATGYYNPTAGNTARYLFLLKLQNVPAGTVNLPESPDESPVTLYPNPSSGTFNIKLSKPGTVNLYTSAGQQVYSRKFETAGDISITPQTKLETGIYFVKVNITGSEKVNSGKLLIQNSVTSDK